MNENTLLKGYSLCLNEWALDKDIKNELGLLLIISSLCAKKGYCYASNEYFAKLFGLDASQISKKLSKLYKKGYIQIAYQRRGTEIILREIRLAEVHTTNVKNDIRPMSKMTFDQCQNCHSTNVKNDKENIISNNIISNNIKKERKTLTNYDDLISSFNFSERLKNTILDFIQMRTFIKKPLTNKGLELMIKKLQKMSSNEDEQVQILEQSIMSNWQGIFPLKEEQKKTIEKTNRFVGSNSFNDVNFEKFYSNL